jgi:hypothetical protein
VHGLVRVEAALVAIPQITALSRLRLRPQPVPSDRALAFFDPLLACAALVVETDDILGGPSMLVSRLRLDGEVRIGTANSFRRTLDRAREEVANPL